jgi:hypothetical protein
MTMTQAYSDPSRASDPHALPDIEVFHMDKTDIAEEQWINDDGELHEPGWYWWSCFPGCLPDGDPCGPFETEAAALADARSGLED